VRNQNIMTIDLFIASGAETKETRNKIVLELKKLSRLHESSGFDFNVLWWEDENAAMTPLRRSQDAYYELIDQCDMVAVIIENKLGMYTKLEFDYAVKQFDKTKRRPKVVVYTLDSSDDSPDRFHFIQNLKKEGRDYFYQKVDNNDALCNRIIGELLYIKNEYEREQKQAIAEAGEKIIQLHAKGKLTKSILEHVIKGNYDNIINEISLNQQDKSVTTTTITPIEEANNAILTAKLALINVKNHNRFYEAEQLFKEAIKISHEPDTLLEYAHYCAKQNWHKKAIDLYTETLRLYRNMATSNPDAYIPHVAKTLNSLAILHRKNNDYEKAEAEFNEALQLRRALAVTNPDAYNPDVAMTLNNLAILHRNNNEYEKAEAEYSEALQLYRTLAADNPVAYNPVVATTLNNLAVLHRDNNEYEKAEAEYSEALQLYRTLAADNPSDYNPNVAMTLNNLANLHQLKNDYKKAEAEYNEALQLYRALAADNHDAYNPDVAMTINNLANLHKMTNDYEKAEAEYNEALQLRRALAADNSNAYNPDVAMTLYNLADFYFNLADYTQAETLYTEALALITPFYERYPNAHKRPYDIITQELKKLRSRNQ